MRKTAEEYKDVLVDWPDVWHKASKYIHSEPPFFAQQLYGEYLGPVLQEILTRKNANPKVLLDNAAANFQERFLNKAFE